MTLCYHLKTMVEREELFLVSKVPLSYYLAPVATLGQHFWDKNLFLLYPTSDILGCVGIPARVGALVETIPQRKTTCEQGGTGGRANSCACIKLSEKYSF